MIRFANGKPTAIWYSQHENGEAFTYDAVHKTGVRPIVYSANGSHANYATVGTHDHTIPNLDIPHGLLEDYTDAGPIWDPTLSAYYYTYNANTQQFAAYDNSAPTSYLTFTGQWGDKQYPNSDPRQLNYLDLNIGYRYTSGPNGPRFKGLNRTGVCPDGDRFGCIVRTGVE
ncbi:hypothetical protein BDV97DRAFT_425035 [Delphinella strobiligena]|nr:hypothetical protein BDV97DRAFT_425035 [Delphinella strobiligena]